MSKCRVFLIVFAVLCLQRSASSQAVSGASFITGFELGSLGEGIGTLNGGAVQSAIKRSGNYAYEAHALTSNPTIAFGSRSSGGAMRQIFKSSRFHIYIAALPLNGSVSIVKLGGAGTFNPEVDLNSDGTLTLADSWYPVISKSTLALSPDGQWHRVEFDVGNGLRVYVDGALWASGAGASTNYPAAASISFGAGQSPTYVNATADLFFDDILISSASFASTGLPGDGHAVLLRPTADPAALNSWTGGAGSPASVYMNVKNVPASGKPPASATNTSQAKNGSNHSNQDYKPFVQSYLSGGVPLGATINAVMALSNDGQETAKGGARSGLLWIDQNPAQGSGYTFDYGDALNAVGSFPAGWASHFGPVSSSPAVNLAGAPVIAVRKSSGSNVDVDFLGVYVDYR